MGLDFLISGLIAKWIVEKNENKKVKQIAIQSHTTPAVSPTKKSQQNEQDISIIKSQIYTRIKQLFDYADKASGLDSTTYNENMITLFLTAVIFVAARNGCGEMYVPAKMFDDALSLCELTVDFSVSDFFKENSTELQELVSNEIDTVITLILVSSCKFFPNEDKAVEIVKLIYALLAETGNKLSSTYPLNNFGTSGRNCLSSAVETAYQRIIEERLLG